MKRMAPFAGWTALVSGLLALLVFIVLPEMQLWWGAFGGLALLNGLFFLTVDRENIRRALRSRRAFYGTNAIVLVAVVLGILVFANLLAVRHKHKFDFTETGYFTLAPQTVKILENLPREVQVTAFFAGNTPEKIDFENLTGLFGQHTQRIRVNVVDPDKNPVLARQYKFTNYGMVVFESAGKSQQIKKPTEENIVNALLQVTTDNKKKVYFLEGHSERDIDDREKLGYAKAGAALKQDGFEVAKLLLIQTTRVPDDADLLIINGPEKIIQRVEQNAIEAYLDRGGSVFLLLDPQIEVGIGSLLKRWGVQLQDDLIVDPRSQLAVGSSAVPVINQYAKHGITKDFALPTIFPVLRSVRTVKAQGVETHELLFSGPDSWAETEYRLPQVKFDEYRDLRGPVPVAVVSTKIPLPADQPTGKDNKGKAATRKGNLVVVGDSDFATNQYFDFSGNGDFFSNTASWLLREENLISVRPRERKNTPLALTNIESNLTFILGTIVFPGAVLLAGVRVWWRRRRL